MLGAHRGAVYGPLTMTDPPRRPSPRPSARPPTTGGRAPAPKAARTERAPRTARRTAGRSYHHGDLRAAVIAAALEILASKGSDALALREVARRVGVSHRAIYRHYADKTALLAAIAEQGFLRLADAVEARLEQLDHGLSQRPRPAEPAWVDTEMRLVAIGEAYVTLALERPADFQVMFGPRLNEDGRFPALEAAIERVLRPLLATIDDGIAAGALTAAERGDHMIAMWSLLHGFGTLVLFGRVRVRPELVQPYLRRIVSLSLRGVLRAPR